VITFTPRKKQAEAVAFLQNELFTTPLWLSNEQIFSLSQNGGVYQIAGIQESILNQLLTQKTLCHLLMFQSHEPLNAYTPDQLLTDLEKGIFKELQDHLPVDMYRRNLQKIYVQCLIGKANSNEEKSGGFEPAFARVNSRTDIPSIIKGHLKKLEQQIGNAIPSYRDISTKEHLQDIKDQLHQTLESGKKKN